MSSPVIPREKLSAYQRWELHSFDSPVNDTLDRRQGGDRRQSPPAAPAPAPAVDNTRELTEQAYQTGLAEGTRRGALSVKSVIRRRSAVFLDVDRAEPIDRLLQPFAERNRRLPLEPFACQRDIGLALRRIVGRQRPVNELGL